MSKKDSIEVVQDLTKNVDKPKLKIISQLIISILLFPSGVISLILCILANVEQDINYEKAKKLLRIAKIINTVLILAVVIPFVIFAILAITVNIFAVLQ